MVEVHNDVQVVARSTRIVLIGVIRVMVSKWVRNLIENGLTQIVRGRRSRRGSIAFLNSTACKLLVRDTRNRDLEICLVIRIATDQISVIIDFAANRHARAANPYVEPSRLMLGEPNQ